MIFVEAVQSEEEAAFVADAFPNVPLLFNWAEGGKTPPIELVRLEKLGYRAIIFPLSTLLAATRSMREVLAQIRERGTPAGALEQLPPLGEFLNFIGLPEVESSNGSSAARTQSRRSDEGSGTNQMHEKPNRPWVDLRDRSVT